MKNSKADVSVKEAKFIYGNVLIGLALIHQNRSHMKSNGATLNGGHDDDASQTVESIVEQTTRAIAPFLVPMIDCLGALTADEAAGLAQAGDEE